MSELEEAIKLFGREDLLGGYGIQDTDTNIEVFMSIKDMVKYYRQDLKIKRLKEEYMILQNSSDEVEEELQQRINKAIHRIQLIQMDGEVSIKDLTELVNILKGIDKE